MRPTDNHAPAETERACKLCKHKERDFHELPCRVCGRDGRNFERAEDDADENA